MMKETRYLSVLSFKALDLPVLHSWVEIYPKRTYSKACIFLLNHQREYPYSSFLTPSYSSRAHFYANHRNFKLLRTHKQGNQEDTDPKPTKIDESAADSDMAESELDIDMDTYPTLSSPIKYFLAMLLFVVFPVGAWVYFYGGGKQRVQKWNASRGKGYEKVDLGRP